MIRLQVLSSYANQTVSYSAGEVIEVDENLGEFLLKDSKESFRLLDAVMSEKSLDAPPAHKAILTAPAYKKMTAPQLRKELALRGLPQTGKKAELVKRLEDNE